MIVDKFFRCFNVGKKLFLFIFLFFKLKVVVVDKAASFLWKSVKNIYFSWTYCGFNHVYCHGPLLSSSVE